tara:strand:- start:1484 stop:2503 length:1020 start_codon:yes stop_codon:yes gene_type:complete
MSNKKIFNLIKDLSRNISILDIGARGGLGWPWKDLNKDFVDLILVEPDINEAQKIEKNLNKFQKAIVLPFAFWSNEGSLSLNLNQSPGTSSIFNSNHSFLNQFPDYERFQTIEKIKIKSTTIDNLINSKKMPPFDFAKLDIQGGELAVLKGGESYLKSNVIGLEIEVEFVKMYKDQPLFAEVDMFVRNNIGLELWDLSKAHWKYSNTLNDGPSKGRLIFGNALYFRPLESLDRWLSDFSNQEAIEKLLMLITATISYGYLDYSNAILEHKVCSKYIDNNLKLEILKNLNSISKSFKPFKNGNNILYKIFYALSTIFQSSKNGRISDAKLGSQKKGPFWL